LLRELELEAGGMELLVGGLVSLELLLGEVDVMITRRDEIDARLGVRDDVSKVTVLLLC
jgi:hypothetical protein